MEKISADEMCDACALYDLCVRLSCVLDSTPQWLLDTQFGRQLTAANASLWASLPQMLCIDFSSSA